MRIDEVARLLEKWNAQDAPIRPPWARVTGPEFRNLCDDCSDCIEACSEGILVRGSSGYPQVDFARGSCSFCGDCARACRKEVFCDREWAPWFLTPLFGMNCLAVRGAACRICGDCCFHGAIRYYQEPGEPLEIEVLEKDCTGCGACAYVCPVEAIRMLEEREPV